MIFFSGCLPPTVASPLIISGQLQVYPVGFPAVFACMPGFTLDPADAFAECLNTFIFGSFVANCLASKYFCTMGFVVMANSVVVISTPCAFLRFGLRNHHKQC